MYSKPITELWATSYRALIYLLVLARTGMVLVLVNSDHALANMQNKPSLRLLIDVQYLMQKLSSLDGVDGPGNHLEVVVNNIKIKDRRMSSVPPPAQGKVSMDGKPAGTPTTTGGGNVGGAQSQAQAQQQKKTTNFASAFGNMLKTKNAGLPGGQGQGG